MDKITPSYFEELKRISEETQKGDKEAPSVFELERYLAIKRISEITKEPNKIVGRLENGELKKFAFKTIHFIEDILLETLERAPGELVSLYLPPIKTTRDEDGALWVELIRPGFRLGLIIEEEIEKSQWFNIRLTEGGDISSYGPLSRENMPFVIRGLIDTVTANT